VGLMDPRRALVVEVITTYFPVQLQGYCSSVPFFYREKRGDWTLEVGDLGDTLDQLIGAKGGHLIARGENADGSGAFGEVEFGLNVIARWAHRWMSITNDNTPQDWVREAELRRWLEFPLPWMPSGGDEVAGELGDDGPVGDGTHEEELVGAERPDGLDVPSGVAEDLAGPDPVLQVVDPESDRPVDL
jgi:hypothetical protein